MTKLSVKALGLAGGIFWGGGLFLWTGVVALLETEWSRGLLNLMVGMYPWYDVSLAGAVAGLIFGFIDGFIGCSVFAWLYNKFAK